MAYIRVRTQLLTPDDRVRYHHYFHIVRRVDESRHLGRSGGCMIVPVSQIPAQGLHVTPRLALSRLSRLVELTGAQAGELAADVVLKNRLGHVEVTGTLRAALRVPCNRCLDPVGVDIDEPVRIHLAPESSFGAGGVEIRLVAEDLEVSFYRGEAIDLHAVLEDELILLLPASVGEEDEDGRCTACGRTVSDVLPPAPPDEAAHPLASLRELVRRAKD
jgi:uncharacterized protein